MLKKNGFAGLKGGFDWDAKIVKLRHVFQLKNQAFKTVKYRLSHSAKNVTLFWSSKIDLKRPF